MDLLSVKETANRFSLSERRVQKLCEAGRIEGAQMISNVWLIPNTSPKPLDERYSAEYDEMISLQDLCKKLSISVATGRNWVKLGKIIPQFKNRKTLYFAPEYVEKLKAEIISGENVALKSRRNKKYISGHNIYNAYVSDNSLNIQVIEKVIDTIEQDNILMTDEIMLSVLADCALKLVCAKENIYIGFNQINGNMNNNVFALLVSDLIKEVPSVEVIKQEYPQLFDFNYSYEENEDILGLLYISLQNMGNRKATGAYYTPTKVVKKLCDNLFRLNSEFENKTYFDPCCGTGNFILQLPSSIDYSQVYGNDIDSISVKLARINFALKYNIDNLEEIYNHITETNYLSFQTVPQYDYIIGNPPWGYEFSDSEKNALRKKYTSASGTSIESYDVFIEQALDNLTSNGVLSFILPEAVLNVKTHTSIRKLMIEKVKFQYVEFLGNAFDKVQCPCIILQVLLNKQSNAIRGVVVNDGTRVFTINEEHNLDPEYLSFGMTDEEHAIIKKMDSLSNKVTLKDNATFALGIVTGNNKKYITSEKKPNNEMILKGSDINKFRFSNSENYIEFLPESFQQVAPVEYYRASEKLLYRFICDQLVFAYDNNGTLSLNSCNILIPQIPGLSAKYIIAILNSRMAQFYFKKRFNSVKVLRSHIEQIPIPHVKKEVQDSIVSLVDAILETPIDQNVVELYNNLDKMICDLFGLSNAEYETICIRFGSNNLFLT